MLGAHRRLVKTEIGDDRSLVDVLGDLFSATLGGNVLHLSQLCPSGLLREAQEITSHDRDCTARALFPRRVGR